MTIDGQIVVGQRDTENDQWVFNLPSDGLVVLPISESAEYEIIGSNNVIYEELTAIDGQLTWNAELDDQNEAGDMQIRFSNWGLVLFNVPAQP